MSEIILSEELKESLDRSQLLMEWKAVWREAQHTRILLELPSLWESTGCLSGEASAPFHQSSCCQVGVSEVESFLLFSMRHHQRIRVTESFLWK